MKTIIIDGIEYNLTPKVLFKKGDFVVIQETTYQITKVENLNVTLSLNGRECIFNIDVLKNAHHWTIQDAKDGDVLVDVYGNIGIYEICDDFGWMSYCSLGNNGGFQHFNITHENEKTHPSTKEQRDTLMKAMADAGYTFDFKNNKLKKIKYKFTRNEKDETSIAINNSDAYRIGFADGEAYAKEEKPTAWSEEDCSKVQRICKYLNEAKKYYADITEVRECMEWLKSLEKRYTWKPSDEQIEALESATENCAYSEYQDCLRELIEQLKNLKGE